MTITGTGSLPLPSLDDETADRLLAGLSAVERRLAECSRFPDEFASRTAQYLLQAGGKRVRPVLVLLAAELGEGWGPAVVECATAVEITHLASLYHDDVMDSAPTRRGAPSAHTVWNNSIAILTGDLLFARATQVTSAIGPEAVRIQSRTFERLVLGQLHETLGPQDGEDPIEHHLGVLADKTGSLIAAACEYGALFGRLDQELSAALIAYGELIGVAFQLQDDVLDLRSDSGSSGKTPGTDLRESVPTLPRLLLAKPDAPWAGHQSTAGLLDLLAQDLSSDETLARAVAAFRAHPALEAAHDMARQWADRAVTALAPLPAGEVRTALEDFARRLVDRSS